MNVRQGGEKKLLAAIRKISDKPIKYVINTDSDSVHVGGYRFFSKLGATIIAQQDANISDEISTIKFKDSMVVNFNEQVFEIYHHVANSFDDAIVFLPKSNLLIMGNIYSIGWFPVFFSGGISGFNAALDNALSLANASTEILPSTGELSDIGTLRQYKQNTNDMIARIHHLRLLEVKAESMIEDAVLNKIWLRMTGDTKLNVRVKQRMVNRYISTDFIASFPLAKHELIRFSGNFQFDDKSTASIILRSNKLFINEGTLAELIPQSNSLFHVRGSGTDSIQFEFDNNDEVIGFSYMSQGEKYSAIKV
jgi:hypothetical protein